jgi:hypothetical protein
MGKRNSHSFNKLQKLLTQNKKAKEKLARRQENKDQAVIDVEEQKSSDDRQDMSNIYEVGVREVFFNRNLKLT